MTAATKPHRGLAVYAALVAASAYGGAVGLATGVLDLGDEINRRLPLHSPVLAAVALTTFVAVPVTALARRAARGDRRIAATASFSGWTLIAWIVVELAIIRELSPLQPLYLTVGASFLVIGRRLGRVTASPDRRSVPERSRA